jgi:exoribonuclease R
MELKTKDYKHFTIGKDVAFEGAAKASRALPGDLVEWDSVNDRVATILDRGYRRDGGRIFLTGLLECNSKVKYGMSSRGVPSYLFTPFDESYPPFYVGSKQTGPNVLATIEYTGWPEGSACPHGTLYTIHGPAGSFDAEETALLWHYAGRPEKAHEKIEVAKPKFEKASDRLLGLNTFHVDPPGCRDIDDAITLEVGPNAGSMILHIHIADVASYLLENGTILSSIGEKGGQTFYKDGAAVRPMFPRHLSEGLFSLLPGQERTAWTLSRRWTIGVGFTGPATFSLQKIIVKESYTYDSVVTSLWAPLLTTMATDYSGTLKTDPHEWIEELMLMYNIEVAKLLKKHGVGILRKHEAPDFQKLEVLESLGLPAERLAFKAGVYCSPAEEITEHWGLDVDAYCHASSPIRRWADCVNQMALRAILWKDPLWVSTAEELEHLNKRAKAAKGWERDRLFVRAILGNDGGGPLEGVVAQEGQVWIGTWGRLIKVPEVTMAPGTPVRVSYFCDATKRNWKRRLVFRIEP